MVGAEIDRRKVVLEEAIRTSGEHKVTVHLVGKLRPQITVIVNGQQDRGEAAEAETAEAEVEGRAPAPRTSNERIPRRPHVPIQTSGCAGASFRLTLSVVPW